MNNQIFAAEIVAIAISGLMTLAICSCAMPIGRALGLLDDPNVKAHGLHDAVVPLVGGVAIFVPLLVLIGLAMPFLAEAGATNNSWGAPLGLGIVLLAMGALGAIDDRIGLTAKLRLTASLTVFAAMTIVEPAMVIRSIDFAPLGGAKSLGFLAVPFTVLCLTALTNAVNMADGRNGLVLGMALIWCAAFMPFSANSPQIGLMAIFISLAITFAFNLRGKLFLGDAGAYGLSFVAGAYAIYLHNVGAFNTLDTLPGGPTLSSSQAGSLFLIPILDMVRVMGERLMKGHPMMLPDHDHLHHRLDRQFGWSWGLPIYLTLVALPIVASQWSQTSGISGLVVGCLLYGAVWLATREGPTSPYEEFTLHPAE